MREGGRKGGGIDGGGGMSWQSQCVMVSWQHVEHDNRVLKLTCYNNLCSITVSMSVSI
jgi:hypothetical protein